MSKRIMTIVVCVGIMLLAFGGCGANDDHATETITTNQKSSSITSVPTEQTGTTSSVSALQTTIATVTTTQNKVNTEYYLDEESGLVIGRGEYEDKNWDETLGTYTGDVIPDQETAIAVAQAIFDNMEKGERTKQFVVDGVFYDEVDEIWIVGFSMPYREDVILSCGGVEIAIKASNGEVLRIWHV